MLFPALPNVTDRLGIAGQTLTAVSNVTLNAFGTAYVWLGDVPADWCAFDLDLLSTSTRDVHFDIAVGAAGGGDAIAGRVATLDACRLVDGFTIGLASLTPVNVHFPVRVPCGVGLYARLAATSANTSVGFAVTGYRPLPGGHPGFSGVESVGFSTGARPNLLLTIATQCTGAIDANGAWAQALDASGRDYVGLYTSPLRGGQNSSRSAQNIVFSLGLQTAAGTTAYTLADRLIAYSGTSAIWFPTLRPCMTPIVAGSRIVARATAAANTATDKVAVAVMAIKR